MRTDKKRFSTRLAAAVMAGTLAVGMMGMSVFAEGTEEKPSTPETTATAFITKKITKRAEVYSPNTSFEFKIIPGTAVAATSDSKEIKAGPEGGVTFTNKTTTATIASEPTLQLGNSPTELTIGTQELVIHEEKFKTGANWNPGIYRYNIAETSGKYEGITYDTATRYFDVYVTNEGIVYKAFVKESNSNEKGDGIFINDYDKEHKNKINDLTIEKKLEGNMADATKEFEFTVKIAGADGEKYNVIYSDGRTAGTITSNIETKITLKGGQTARITGLSHGDTYTVNEKNYTSEGYETTNRDNAGNITADKTITITNKKDATTPTGIVLNYGPYILMIALAGSMAVFFFRRKNHKEA